MLFLISDIVSTGSPQYIDVVTVVDKTSEFSPGLEIYVKDVTNDLPANNEIFTVQTSVFIGTSPGITRIFTVESIPVQLETNIAANDVYWLAGGILTVHYTDDNLKSPIKIVPTQLDTTNTSLSLIGRGTLNYGEAINENMMRILENFASGGVAPSNPTIGQMWWDHSSLAMKVWNGTLWQAGITIDAGDSLILLDGESSPIGNPHHLTGGGISPDVGIQIYPQTDPLVGDSIFRVLNASGTEQLRVERDAFVKVGNALAVEGVAGNSYFLGKLAIGSNTITSGYQFQVTGNTNITGTLDVTQAVTSTLTVSGITTLNGPVVFNGPTPINFNVGVDLNNSHVSNMLDPNADSDGATKNYVDVSLYELDVKKLDRVSNLPITEVGHLVPEYIPTIVGDSSNQCAIICTRDHQMYWFRETTGIVVGLIPQYNGERIITTYAYTKTGRFDEVVFSGYEYRPATLGLSASQFISRVLCSTPNGFHCILNSGQQYWIDHNGTLDPDAHTSTLITAMSSDGVIRVPEFNIWLAYRSPTSNSNVLEIDVYESDATTFRETLTFLNWTTDITYAPDTSVSPNRTASVGTSYPCPFTVPNISYYVSGGNIVISSIFNVLINYQNVYSSLYYNFGVNALGTYDPTGPTSWTLSHALPYAFNPTTTPVYPIFEYLVKEEGAPFYVAPSSGEQLVTTSKLDDNTVLLTSRSRNNTQLISGQILANNSWDYFVSNIGRHGQWFNGDESKINHIDGQQRSFITNATPIGHRLTRAGWASPNDIFFTANSYMPNSGDTPFDPSVERSGWSVHVADPGVSRQVDLFQSYGHLAGYTGDFISLSDQLERDSNIVDNMAWDGLTTMLDDTGKFVVLNGRVDDTDPSVLCIDEYDYVSKTSTPNAYNITYGTMISIDSEIVADVGFSAPFKISLMGVDSAYIGGFPQTGNVLLLVAYSYQEGNPVTTHFKIFTVKWDGTTATRVSPFIEIDSGTGYGGPVDGSFLDTSISRGACYYVDTVTKEAYVLANTVSYSRTDTSGYSVKIVAVKVSTDNSGTPGNLLDWEIIYDTLSNEHQQGITISIHDLYGPCITMSGVAYDMFGKVMMKYQDNTTITSYTSRMTQCWNDWLSATPPTIRGLMSLRPPEGFNFYTADIPIFVGGTYRIAPSSLIDIKSSFSAGSPPDYLNSTFYSFAELTNNGPSIVLKDSITAETLSSTHVGWVTTDSVGVSGYNIDQNVTRIDEYKIATTPAANSVVISQSNGKIDSKWLNVPISTETGVSYTFAVSDENVHKTFNSESTQTVIVPLDSSVPFPIGTEIQVSRQGTGAVTFQPAGGVTINSADGDLSLRVQYSEGILLKTDTNVWLLSGDLA